MIPKYYIHLKDPLVGLKDEKEIGVAVEEEHPMVRDQYEGQLRWLALDSEERQCKTRPRIAGVKHFDLYHDVMESHSIF